MGFVYLLVSTKIAIVKNCGQAMEIRWELKIINCGNEPIETRPSETRPWAILAFVTGHKTEDMCSNNTQRITVDR